jgi:hypothetical protein
VERTLKEHLDWLQARLKTVNEQLMDCECRAQANRLQVEIRAIELAIAHYQAALEIEDRIISDRL